jgi:molybdopterin/thiamine biosynthesis adenylyltransferase
MTDRRPTSADGLRASRVVRLGAFVTGRSEQDLHTALRDSGTIISVETSLEGAAETATILLSSLARMPGQVCLVNDDAIDGRDVLPVLGDIYSSLRAEQTLTVAPSVTEAVGITGPGVTTHVHVGLEQCRDQACASSSRSCVRVVPDGYGAHLVRDGMIEQKRPPYATGHMLAAAFGAGEAFTIAADITVEPTTQQPVMSFCPVTLSDDLTAAPDLPAGTEIDAALLGLGAVGTAAVVILAGMGIGGSLLVADRQQFAEENVGTYSLGTAADAAAETHKVDLAADALRPHFDIYEHRGDIADLPARVDANELPWPHMVLSAVDSIDARHDVQRLWADQHIDVGTGSTTVGLHHARAQGACLQCFFPIRTDGPTPEQRLADQLGIDARALGRDEPWTDEEIAALPASADPRLATLIGKPKCATANLLGITSLPGADDYRPSVPFVSQQAACLLVGRLIAELLSPSPGQAVDAPPQTNFAQFDTLVGPTWADLEGRDPSYGCYCQQRRPIIARVRDYRSALSTKPVRTGR